CLWRWPTPSAWGTFRRLFQTTAKPSKPEVSSNDVTRDGALRRHASPDAPRPPPPGVCTMLITALLALSFAANPTAAKQPADMAGDRELLKTFRDEFV